MKLEDNDSKTLTRITFNNNLDELLSAILAYINEECTTNPQVSENQYKLFYNVKSDDSLESNIRIKLYQVAGAGDDDDKNKNKTCAEFRLKDGSKHLFL